MPHGTRSSLRPGRGGAEPERYTLAPLGPEGQLSAASAGAGGCPGPARAAGLEVRQRARWRHEATGLSGRRAAMGPLRTVASRGLPVAAASGRGH
jgi:hypothetical protein